MPLGESVVTQPVVDSIVGEIVEKALLHFSCFGVAVDIPQGIQCPFVVRFLKSAAMISLLPEMPCPIEHSVEAHGGVPVEPVHDAGQVFWLWFEQIVNVITHDAEGIEFELELLYRFLK